MDEWKTGFGKYGREDVGDAVRASVEKKEGGEKVAGDNGKERGKTGNGYILL